MTEIVNDIIQWDVRSWSVALDYWDQNVNWSQVHQALELGGREGGLSLWLALKGKQVICSDLENTEITAAALHKRYGVSGLITYRDIDATSIPYENSLDLIVFKSIIGGIGRNNNPEMQQKVFDEIYKALKPGGKLLFAENLIASPAHQLMRKKFVRWGNSWRYVSLDEMKRYLRNFTACDIRATGFLSAFGRSEGMRKYLSIADALVLNKFSPDDWKYISYGIATK